MVIGFIGADLFSGRLFIRVIQNEQKRHLGLIWSLLFNWQSLNTHILVEMTNSKGIEKY